MCPPAGTRASSIVVALAMPHALTCSTQAGRVGQARGRQLQAPQSFGAPSTHATIRFSQLCSLFMEHGHRTAAAPRAPIPTTQSSAPSSAAIFSSSTRVVGLPYLGRQEMRHRSGGLPGHSTACQCAPLKHPPSAPWTQSVVAAQPAAHPAAQLLLLALPLRIHMHGWHTTRPPLPAILPAVLPLLLVLHQLSGVGKCEG